MKSSIKINAISNYFAKFWGLISVYAFIPLYIHLLGNENYALIAFQSVILSFIFIADAGLSSSFSRECAKEKSSSKLLVLLSGIEKVLFTVLCIISIAFFLLSPYIAQFWLKIHDPLFLDGAILSLKLMAISLIPQVMISLYYGGLMGLERQVKANVINIVYTFVRSGMVLIPLFFWRSIETYFLWYALISITFCLLFRYSLVKTLSVNVIESEHYDKAKLLKELLPFSLGMLYLSIISAVNNQLDRLYVSYKFNLSDFSYYNLSSILGQASFLVVLPLAVTILPRLTKLLSENKKEDVYKLYEAFCFYIASIASTAVFSLILYSHEIIELWLGESYLHTSIVKLVPVLSVGTLFLALQLMPFQLSIANGHNKTSVKLGVISLIIYPIMLVFFCFKYKLIGATFPWVVINALNFLVLAFYINHRFYISFKRWFFSFCLLPVIISFIVVYVGHIIVHFLSQNHIISFTFGAGVGLISLLLSFIIFKKWIQL